jgi:ketosteroid isomerase-like protein
VIHTLTDGECFTTARRTRGNRVSADDNVKTIQHVYEAFGRGDVAAILEVVADDVDWGAEAASTEAPWWGVRTDKQAVTDFFAQIASTYEVLEFTPLVMIGDGDDVLTVVRFRAKATKSGKTADMEIHHHFHFTGGKISRYRGTEDTLQTWRVLEG